MKKRILSIVLPAAVLFAAAGGAFASNSGKKTLLLQENGFIHKTSETACNTSIKCQVEEGDLCMTTDGYQVWKKNASLQCVVPLYRIPN